MYDFGSFDCTWAGFANDVPAHTSSQSPWMTPASTGGCFYGLADVYIDTHHDDWVQVNLTNVTRTDELNGLVCIAVYGNPNPDGPAYEESRTCRTFTGVDSDHADLTSGRVQSAGGATTVGVQFFLDGSIPPVTTGPISYPNQSIHADDMRLLVG